LVEMDLGGIASDLKECFPGNVYVSDNPRRYQKMEIDDEAKNKSGAGDNGMPLLFLPQPKRLVRPLDVAEILSSCGPLLEDWQSFAGHLDIPSTQYKQIGNQYTLGLLSPEQLFTNLLIKKCGMGELPLSLVCKAMGKWKGPIEKLLKKFPGDNVYISEETAE